MRCALHRCFFRLPDFLEIGELLLKLAQLLVEIVQPLARCLVGFFLERFTLDLELNNSPLELVQRFGF